MAPNELEKKLDNQSLVAPDYFANEKPEGLEHLTEGDIQMPRLLIAQGLSPQLNPAKPNFIEGLSQGQFFNSLTEQIYGKGPLQFCVIRADMPRWVEFIPRDLGGGVKDPKVPFGDPRTEFQPDGKPPIATKFYDFIIRLLPSGEMIALSMKSTGLKVARQLNGLMQARMKPIWTGVYQITAPSMTNAKGKWFIPAIKNAGWVSKEIAQDVKDTYEMMKNRVIDIDMPEFRGAEEQAEPGDTSFDPVELEKQGGEAEVHGM
jgi:hypothetical protein